MTAFTLQGQGRRPQSTPPSSGGGITASVRSEGVDVTYRRYRLGEHLIVMFRGVRPALRFLADRLQPA
jgi:hypothetical protein